MAQKKNYSEWSKEELIREILALKKQKTYGLVWEREKTKEDFDLFINWEGEKTKEEFTPESKDKFPVLSEVKENDIVTDKSKPLNLLIEGDNYHSLAVLNFTHKNAIDVIYIDPPYNTGNKDFKYNDRFVDREDGYRHSKWLSFMSKRLTLSKNLLRDSGVIFISIDDNELAQLKILCDDIFGEENFIANLVWQKKVTPANDSKYFSGDHEYILVYGKRKSPGIIQRLERTQKQMEYYKNPDGDARGPWNSIAATCNKSKKERPNLYYPIRNPTTGKEIWPKETAVWANSKETFAQLITENRVYWGKDGKSESPRIKLFLDEAKNVIPRSILYYEDVGHTQSATTEFRAIFPKGGFDYPKPVSLIKHLLKLSGSSGVVLDFMAGSGTTGHAVLELNNEDNKERRFILCTNDEGKICSEVCYPRLSKVISGYADSKKISISGLGGNLKYFKTDFVEAAPTDKNKKKLVDKCTEMLCIKENAFERVKDAKKFKIFKNDSAYLGIIFDDEHIEEFVAEAEKLKGRLNVYVFSHDDSVPTKEFKKIKSRITLKPIPESILKVYRMVFKDGF